MLTALFVLVLSSTTAVAMAPASPVQADGDQERGGALVDSEAGFFGYDVGEERVYRIGPPEALAPGEGAEWRIRFDGLREHEWAGVVARIEFEHVRFELIPGTWNPAEDLMEVAVTGEAVLSLDGFPLEVDFVQRFLTQGETTAEDARRRLRFVYDPDAERYEKYIEVGRRDWDFRFGLPGSDEVDKDALRGLFLYLPSALGCIGTSRATCIAAEPAFSNPGFLSFVLPFLLEEEKSERQFHFFMPSSIGGSPFRPTNAARWISSERNNIRSQDRHFERWKLKLGASEDVEVGPRTVHAWELDLGGGIDKVWIEPSGRVVRVDLETTWTNTDDRHIRLVFPHEEFLSPNSDPAEECC